MGNRYRNRVIKANASLPTAGSASGVWSVDIQAEYNDTSWPSRFNMDYVLVAGGGGGGTYISSNPWYSAGPGGGAGGYISSVPGEFSGGLSNPVPPIKVVLGTTYVITLGGGGAASAAGVNSTIAYSPVTITAYGGGVGGSNLSSSNVASVNLVGGSNGGIAYAPVVNVDISFKIGVFNQGSLGGSSSTRGSPSATFLGGGGGGAGGVGLNGVAAPLTPVKAGNGGVGISTNITGTPTYYGGGGGGGAYGSPFALSLRGFGGLGGGGDGNYNDGSAKPGTAGGVNTGGGGGGGTSSPLTPGTAGGSGVCILRVQTTLGAPSTITGTYTSGTTGEYTWYRFTSSGTIKWG